MLADALKFSDARLTALATSRSIGWVLGAYDKVRAGKVSRSLLMLPSSSPRTTDPTAMLSAVLSRHTAPFPGLASSLLLDTQCVCLAAGRYDHRSIHYHKIYVHLHFTVTGPGQVLEPGLGYV